MPAPLPPDAPAVPAPALPAEPLVLLEPAVLVPLPPAPLPELPLWELLPAALCPALPLLPPGVLPGESSLLQASGRLAIASSAASWCRNAFGMMQQGIKRLAPSCSSDVCVVNGVLTKDCSEARRNDDLHPHRAAERRLSPSSQ
jgi:hypothetical protein